MDQHGDAVGAGIAKAVGLWLTVGLSRLGIHTWSDVAAAAATIWSLIMISEWVWKKLKNRNTGDSE